MKPIRFHPKAEAELVEAARYYEIQQTGLGKRFVSSVQEALAKIGEQPETYRVLDGNVRRCLTRIFPYGIVFRNDEDSIVIVAVMHLHREPGYWRKREIL